ncbi:MAG: formylglycine-generating enzyme family protein [Elusimicrobia bacterium]|nr:formylglycine-generating enzyme family protein [Elusimicrobiota bacterium]
MNARAKYPAIILATLVALSAAWLFSRKQNRAAMPQQPGPVEENAKKLDMALIPAGEFQMGSVEGLATSTETPKHAVYLDAFYMARNEVTVAQYREFAKATGRKMHAQPAASADNHPVVYVDWHDATAYCNWLGARLPTEAEWEKAARAGTESKWHFGDDASVLPDYAWVAANSGGVTHPVGLKKPNQYGLYDMYGNVWNWCSDWYLMTYYKISPKNNPPGAESGIFHSIRGGSWLDHSDVARSAYRYWYKPDSLARGTGIRCAMSRSGAPGHSN